MRETHSQTLARKVAGSWSNRMVRRTLKTASSVITLRKRCDQPLRLLSGGGDHLLTVCALPWQGLVRACILNQFFPLSCVITAHNHLLVCRVEVLLITAKLHSVAARYSATLRDRPEAASICMCASCLCTAV